MDQALSDELLMSLVERALGQPPEQREDWVRSACGGDTELFSRVHQHLAAEMRMKNFLKRPFASYLQLKMESLASGPFEAGGLAAGRFRIVRRVADGGMGVVYEAFDERIQRRVAIKCAKAGFGNRLPPEARHAREITHPGVCRIFDIHTAATASGEIEFLSMEFLDGLTLAERLREGPVQGSTACKIALQLCEGLAEAHRSHVVHGDLKSNNVILVPAAGDAPARAVITDFGLARQPNLADETGNVTQMASAPVGGARAYMAPELTQGAKQTTASDVYAMGVILRELVSGLNTGVPRKWSGVIARCLDENPSRRFSDGGALLHALRPSSGRRRAIGTAAVVLAASISGAITYERATAPKQTVRLALLPFISRTGAAESAAKLSHDSSEQLAEVRGNARTRVVFVRGKVPAAPNRDAAEQARALSATHVLHGTLDRVNPGTDEESEVLHVYLTDAQTGANKMEWKARYTPASLRFAPVALAGMVTNSLGVPPIGRSAGLNPAAGADYAAGLRMVQADGQPEEAIRLLKRVVAADPDCPLAYAGLAEAQAFQARIRHDAAAQESARESVRQAELRNPDLPEVHMISGWLERASGHYELAERHFLRTIEIQAANADAWRRLGQTYGAAGQAGEALDALKRAVQLEPDGFRNHRELGNFYYRRNRFAEAAAEYGAMARLAPGVAESHSLLGETLYQMDRISEAKAELSAAIRLRDTSAAGQTLGAIAWEERKDDEAVKYYLRALELGPETSSAWLSLSFCYREQGLQSKAKNACRRGLAASGRALAQDPRSGREHATQAYFEAMLRDFPRAKTDAEEALTLSRDDETEQFAVMTYEAIGRRDLALKVVEESPGILHELARYPWLDKFRQDSHLTKMLN
jgi:tetratricopeptide (TPR) repeat protein